MTYVVYLVKPSRRISCNIERTWTKHFMTKRLTGVPFGLYVSGKFIQSYPKLHLLPVCLAISHYWSLFSRVIFSVVLTKC